MTRTTAARVDRALERARHTVAGAEVARELSVDLRRRRALARMLVRGRPARAASEGGRRIEGPGDVGGAPISNTPAAGVDLAPAVEAMLRHRLGGTGRATDHLYRDRRA